jgi:hypothetical protein
LGHRFLILASRVETVGVRIPAVFVLNEIEDVEAPQRSIREEAVHRILLIIEEFIGDGQLGQQKQLQTRPIEIYQQQPSTGLAQPSMTQSERAFQVKNDDAFAFPLFDMETPGQPSLARIRGPIMVLGALSSV